MLQMLQMNMCQHWSVRSLNLDKMKGANRWATTTLPENSWKESNVEEYLDAIGQTCAHSMKRAGPSFKQRKPRRDVVWTPELTALRKTANKQRRLRQRAYKKPPEILQMREREYKEACTSLSKALLRARIEAWTNFSGKLESNPWGRPYKTMTKWLKAKLPLSSLSCDMAEQVESHFFPIPEEEEQEEEENWGQGPAL